LEKVENAPAKIKTWHQPVHRNLWEQICMELDQFDAMEAEIVGETRDVGIIYATSAAANTKDAILVYPY
jgi:hypothetical protein